MAQTGPKAVTVTCAYHHAALASGLWNFFERQHSVDFDFRSGGLAGRTVRAHRLVLEVFLAPDKMFPFVGEDRGLGTSTTAHGTADGDLDLLLMEFLYNGTVSVPEERLDHMLDLARQLNLSMLVDAVESARSPDPLDGLTVASPRRQRKGHPAKLLADGLSADATKPTVVTRAKRRLRSGGGVVTGARDDEGGVKRRRQRQNCKDSAAEIELEVSVEEKKVKSATGNLPMLSCEHCTFRTRNQTNLRVHVANKHDPSIAVFHCTTCKKPFFSEDVLAQHDCTGVPAVGRYGRQYECSRCGYTTREKYRWKVHLARHDLTIFRCDACTTVYLSQATLDRHKATAHSGLPVVHQCPSCDFSSTKSNCFTGHLKVVHGINAAGQPIEKRYKCTDCDESFVYESILKRHVTTKHTFARPFKCEHCPYASSRKPDLRLHVKFMHSQNVRSYICETCGFSTVTFSNLVRHRRSHTGEKPFKCQFCGKAYAYGDTLKEHLLTHAEGYSAEEARRFVCHVCGSGFKRKSRLVRHLHNIHKTQTEPEPRYMN